MTERERGRARGPASSLSVDPSNASTQRVPDPADMIGGELAALARGEVPACQCCTREVARRNALDRLHAQRQLAAIASELVALIGVGQ